MKEAKSQQKTFQKRNFYCINDTSNIFFLALIFGLGLSLVYAFVFTKIMAGIDPNFKLQEAQGTPIYLTNYFVSTVLLQLVFFLVYFFYHKVQGISFDASNIKKPNAKESFVWAGLGFVCLLGFMCLIEGCFGHMFSAMKLTADNMKFGNIGIYFLSVLLVGVLPAVIEELIFRGVIYQGMKNTFPTWARVLLCGLLFALMHQSVLQFIYPFILGCVLALIMEKTNNLVYCMMFHFANNFSTLTVGYIMEIFGFDFQNMPMTWWFILVSVVVALVTALIIFLALKFVKSSKTEEEKVGQEPLRSSLSLGKMPLLLLGGIVLAVIIIVINACI